MSSLFDSDFNLGGFFSLGSTRSVYRSRSNSAHSLHSARSLRHRPTRLHTFREHVPRINRDRDSGSECESGTDEHTIYLTTSVISKDIDRGWAWAVLVAAFFCNCINVGINNSVGVYNAEFLRQFPDEKRSYVAVAGSLQNSIAGLIGLVSGIIANKYSCRTSILLGSIISAVGFIGSAFSTNVPEIIATYGFVVGVGTGLVYTATSVCVGQYFHQRRPMALGIATAGMALGQFVCPPFYQYLIETYSWRGSAFVAAGICLNCCVFGTIMKPLDDIDCNRNELASDIDGKISKENIEKCAETSLHNGGHTQGPNDHQSYSATEKEVNAKQGKANGTQDISLNHSNCCCKKSSDECGGHSCLSNRGLNHQCPSIDVSSALGLSVAEVGSTTFFGSITSSYFGTENENTKPSCKELIRGLLDVRPLKKPPFVFLCIATVLWGSASLTCGVHMVAYAIDHGSTPLQGAALMSVLGAGNIFSRLLAGAATNDKDHVDQVTLASGAVGISGLLVLCFPLCIQRYWSQVVFAALYGVYSTILIPLMAPLTVEMVGLSSLGAGFGYMQVASGTGCGIGPPIAGLLFDITQDYSYSFYLAGAIYLCSSVLLLTIPVLESRRRRAEKMHEVT